MKIKLVAGVFLLCAQFVKGNEIPDYLVVWTKDNSCASFLLTEQPRITFTDNEMHLTTFSVNISYDT